MKVKIGSTWHNSEEEPICVEFVGNDRQNVINMVKGCTKYASAPDDWFVNPEDFRTWMGGGSDDRDAGAKGVDRAT